MPGSRRWSGFLALTTTSYVTTFCTTRGAFRICTTSPLNVRPGKESTVKVTLWPSVTRPTSASSTLVSTCMLRRSWAMVNRVGACRLAATVWPRSTLRPTTTPSTGARMKVRSRSTWACRSAASFWATWALAFVSIASATRSWASAERTAEAWASSWALDASCWATAES